MGLENSLLKVSAVHDATITLAVFRIVTVEEFHVDLESLQQLVLATRSSSSSKMLL